MAIDFELLKKEFQEAVAQAAQEEYWVPEFGENLVRILPPRDGKLPYRRVGVHYKLAGSGMVYCPNVVFGERCPICEVVDDLRKLKSAGAVQLAQRLIVVERFLMNLIPLDRGDLRVKQYLAPKTVRLHLIKAMLDPDYGDITDLKTGRNVVIEKAQGGGGFVNYFVRVKPKQVSVDEILGRKFDIDEIPDFDEFLVRKMKTYDELKTVLYGGDEVGMEELVERYVSGDFGGEFVEERNSNAGSLEYSAERAVKQKDEIDLQEILELAKKIVQKTEK